MARKICVMTSVTVVIVLCVSCVCGSDKDISSDPYEVIRRYKKSLAYVQSMAARINIEMRFEATGAQYEYPPQERTFMFCRDNERTAWFGESLVLDLDGSVDAAQSFVINEVMAEKGHLSVVGNIDKLPTIASIGQDYKERQERLFDCPEHGGALFGRMFGSGHRGIAELLKESLDIHLRNDMENVNGIPCCVVQGTTEYGQVTVWIAPEKGYIALKWSVRKSGLDLFDETPIRDFKVADWAATFETTEVLKSGDAFVPAGGNLTHTITHTDGNVEISNYKYDVTKLDTQPDFLPSGAFEFKLPNGTPIRIEEIPGIRYIWQNGKPVVDIERVICDWLHLMVEHEGERLRCEVGSAHPAESAGPAPEVISYAKHAEERGQTNAVRTRRKSSVAEVCHF